MEQVSFQDNGTKVAAVNTKTYIFQRNMSRGPESDLIRTVNIPAMVSSTIQPLSSHWIATFFFSSSLSLTFLPPSLQTVMTMFKDRPLIAGLISSYMRGKGEGLFVTRTVGELLWGYQDGLLTALKKLQPQLDDVFGLFYKVFTVTLSSVMRSEKIRSYWLIYGSFFFSSQSNASNDGEYIFFTGKQNSSDFARVDTWNNAR